MSNKNFEELKQSEEFQELLKKIEKTVKNTYRRLTMIGLDPQSIKSLIEQELERNWKEFEEAEKKRASQD